MKLFTAVVLILIQYVLVFTPQNTFADNGVKPGETNEFSLAKTHKYYGDQFYALISSGGQENSEEIKKEIKAILRGGHIKTSSFDKIVASCNGTADCYQHTQMGYNPARVFLLGKYYLTTHNNQYYVKDVYCDKEYGPEEFPGNGKPGPGIIPEHSVINIEHTWPQSKFTKNYPNEMQKSDMHHLYPSDSQMNSTRGNFRFGEVVKDKQILKCSIARFGYAQDSNELIFQPPKEHMGNVARALFYFSMKYDLKIQPSEEVFLRKWDKEDPIDEEERARNEAIYGAQKSRNPFVDIPNLASQITDF